MTKLLLIISLICCSPTLLQAQEYNWLEIIYYLEEQYTRQPGNKDLKLKLAKAYNNYGLELGAAQKWQLAFSYMRKALQLEPDNPHVKKNFSGILYDAAYQSMQNYDQRYYDSKRFSEERKLLQEAIKYSPDHVPALVLLGEVEYSNQDLTKAEEYWRRALNLQPSSNRIKNLLTKLARERETEDSMGNTFNRYFVIRYDKNLHSNTGLEISQNLNHARANVSSYLSYVQKFKIPVIVYNYDEYFSTILHAPQWSGGLYDGKIRIPMSGDKNNEKRVKSLVVHEYTHAAIADITNNNCPMWLNEGLAMYMEYRYGQKPSTQFLQRDLQEQRLRPWADVNAMFRTEDRYEARTAYEYAFAMTKYLIERYGLGKMRIVLKGLADRNDFDTLIRKTYYRDLNSIESQWKLWLTTNL